MIQPAVSPSHPAGTNQGHSIRVSLVEDPSVWDAAIASLNGSILQSWVWGEFKSRHGWEKALRILVQESGDPVISGQVLIRRIGPFSVLYVPRGPAAREASDACWSAFTIELNRIARNENAVVSFVEPERPVETLQASHGDLAWHPAPVELQPLRTIKVPLDSDDESILQRMKSKTRYNIRLAIRRGVTVREADANEIVPFYEMLEETSGRDRSGEFAIHGIDYYADLLNVLGDSAQFLLAEIDGEIAAGAILFHHLDETIYMFGASTQRHQRHMPAHLIQFEAMRRARERGSARYDLWGIPATDEPPDELGGDRVNVRSGMWGVYRFKLGFGGDIVSYPGVLERQHFPSLVRLWRAFRSGPGA